MPKQALGKGLGALLTVSDDEVGVVTEIKLTDIEPGKEQPRKNFDVEKINQLAESIKQHGVIQPIVLKALDNGLYEIIAGERRWRAARLAQLKTIPAVIKNVDNKQKIEVALVENLQREDLNPIEEAEGYYMLSEYYGLTQDEISSRIGKGRATIANSLRLLGLCAHVKELIICGKLTMGHGRALLGVEDDETQIKIADRIIKEALSVRDAERLVRNLSTNRTLKKIEASPEEIDVENRLSNILGTKVKIIPGKSKSKIEIEYYSDKDLNRILEKLY